MHKEDGQLFTLTQCFILYFVIVFSHLLGVLSDYGYFGK